ncbi:MAG TPA: hypothetical protein VIX17_15585 [Pyrinomonadaceae bacterium]
MRDYFALPLQPAKQARAQSLGREPQVSAIEIGEPVITGDSSLLISAFARIRGSFAQKFGIPPTESVDTSYSSYSRVATKYSNTTDEVGG